MQNIVRKIDLGKSGVILRGYITHGLPYTLYSIARPPPLKWGGFISRFGRFGAWEIQICKVFNHISLRHGQIELK